LGTPYRITAYRNVSGFFMSEYILRFYMSITWANKYDLGLLGKQRSLYICQYHFKSFIASLGCGCLSSCFNEGELA